MATHFSGVGNTSVEDPRTQETDNGSESESQDEDLMRHVLAETANIKQFVEEKYREPREAIHKIEQRLNDLSLALHQQHTPIENVLDWYTETLCTAQKKTSLENTLLQDIPILNGQDSSQLEDWLTDIETAAKLTIESRTKLAQAKSRGLARTLISEALIAQRSWEEIKDSLHLKISNADIHTSISRFMDIQQTDKESLATYVHRFKREANRCKFDNDAATIRIFLKGLKNLHTIATKVYEKGPQTLAETIREVEKLQATQQLTSSLLPASSVNTMSSDQEKCFQCQEVGHMARYCPHIRCYDCNNYGHVAMDCPDKILPSGTPAHCRPGPSERSHRSSSRYNSQTSHLHAMNTEDLGSAALDPDPTTTAIGAAATSIPRGVDQGHSIGLLAAISCMIEAPAPITAAMIHPTTDSPPADISPKTTADLTIEPENSSTNRPEDLHGNLRTENINKSQSTIHHRITIVQMTAIGPRMMI